MSNEVYVPGGKASSWFENPEEALEAAQAASEFGNSGTLVNPEVALAEAQRLLDLAVAMDSKK